MRAPVTLFLALALCGCGAVPAGDTLEDIRHTRDIDYVIVGGVIAD
jgi:hypothetical protein